jgi:hypothetical protein
MTVDISSQIYRKAHQFMKHSLNIVLASLLLFGYLNAQESTTHGEEKKPEERTPIYLDKVTIVLEGEEVLKQEGIHEWAGKAAKIITEWYPKLDKLLESEDFVPAKEITLVFRKMDGVAFASGTQIVISTNWIRNPAGRLGNGGTRIGASHSTLSGGTRTGRHTGLAHGRHDRLHSPCLF